MLNRFTRILIFSLGLCASIVLLYRCGEAGRQIHKEALGKLIFFDPSLSEPSGQSCGTCHRPEKGFADTLGRDISEGAVKGRFNKRNAMSVAYTAYNPPLQLIKEDEEHLYTGGLFWDGRSDSIAHQAGLPFVDMLEMGNQSEEEVVMKIIKAPYYKLFCKIYGELPVSGPEKEENIRKIYAWVLNALAAYQASPEVCPYTSDFDQYLAGNYQMTHEQAKGFEVFKGKGKCADCHILEPDPVTGKVLFTDHTYDNLGIPANPENPFYQMDSLHNPAGIHFIDEGLKATTGRPEDIGLFRVPTLRNIAKTAPYGHNGYFNTLAEIIRFYNVRDVSSEFPAAECPENVNKEELGNLGLTPKEERYLLAFLEMLTDR